ncbi:dna-binding protein [Diplodia corticola]|uniref:Dna-binding protein n=1 Tax=Diplodia corticola TaxID=236234 RepID=A0A1J9QW40_9PEZI|nr:dna-binding protein [Diplodia corticola]OJD32632.1 dna-binding protein [Diplodia corticola]
MARKAPPKSRTSKPASAQKPSSELGDGDLQVRYNTRTGRPIRDNAGRKSLDPSYLDTTEVIDDEGLDSESGSEDEEGVKKKHPKRKRTPSPPLPDVDPLPLYPDDVPSREPTPHSLDDEGVGSINLTVNVPKGFSGPLTLKIDRALFINGQSEPPAKRQHLPSARVNSSKLSTGNTISVAPRKTSIRQRGYFGSDTREDPTKKTFADLPAELRNQIYRLLFVTKEDVSFSRPVNFSRSGALLRTCQQIYKEGRSVLYSENRFAFSRNTHSRAPYWSAQEREVGYQDMRVFLNSIGPTNISLLRSISIVLTDASPSSAPYLDHEGRRFVRDEHIINCFRQISKHGKLKDIELSFYGRKCLCRTDYRFLDALREIKADEVRFEPPEHLWYPSKVDYLVKVALLDSMVRPTKIYKKE